MDSFDDYLKTQKVDDTRTKIYQAAESARKRGVNIPADVADEFYNAMSHESGRSHYNKDGSVKLGSLPINGERAIGFSQVMPGTARPYAEEGLDPFKEPDNIEIGLREFYKGDPSDSVGRRLAYVGGHGTAYNQYKKTGIVSTARMYPATNNQETYADYVEGTSGYKPLDDYLKNQVVGDSPKPIAEQSPNNDPFDNYLKNQTVEHSQVGEGATVNTDLRTGNLIPKPGASVPAGVKLPTVKNPYLGGAVQQPTTYVNPNDDPNNVVLTPLNQQSPIAQTVPSFQSKITAEQLPSADQADLANLGQNQVGQTAFGTDYTPPVKSEYELWLNYQKQSNPNLTDTPETRAAFQQAVDATENDKTSVDVSVPQPNTNQPNTAAVSSPAATNQNAVRQTAPTAPNQPTTYQTASADSLKLAPVATYNVDLGGKPDGISASDYANREALKRTGQFSEAEIDDYLKSVPQKTKYDDYTSAQLKETGAIPVTVRQGTIDEILARRPEQQRLAENERLRQADLDAEQKRQTEARAALEEENRRTYNPTVLERAGGALLNPFGQIIPAFQQLQNQIANNGETPAVSDEEVAAEVERRKALDLSPEERRRTVELGNRLKGEGVGGQLLGGFFGSGAGAGARTLAGIVRPFGAISDTANDLYKELSKASTAGTLIGETSKGDTWTGTAANLAGRLPVDLARLHLLSKLPGGAVVGLSLDAALQSAGGGANLREITKEASKGASIGALFPASSVVGKIAGENLSPVLEPIAKIATVGVGTTGIELAHGTPLDQSIQAGISNGLLEGFQAYGAKIFNKVGRFWQKGESYDVAIDDQGNASLVRFKDQSNPNRVDFEMVLDPTDGVYKDSAEVFAKQNKQSGAPLPQDNFDANQQGNVPNNDVAAYNNEPPNNLEISAAPRELASENPHRIEVAQPEAVQKIALDTRAQKVVENIKDGKTYTVEQLQKATKYNKSNVEETLLTLYSAKQIEILPDNSVRFIGGSDLTTANKSLFDRAGEIEPPKENINLPKSSIESEIYSSDSTNDQTTPAIKQPSNENVQQNQRLSDVSDIDVVQPSNEKAGDLSIYEALPQQKQQAEQVEQPKARIDYKEPENIAEKLNVFTERGRKATIAPKVVDSSDLLTSLDEGYPPEFQPRDRSRTASKAQISEIAGKLNPEFLGDSPKASDGRPLVVPVTMPDGKTKYAVISGNGRTEGIRQAYNLNNDGAKKYAEFVKGKGETTAKQPVYVGVMNPNEIDDFSAFAKEANESPTAQMSASEQAKTDAERMPTALMQKFVSSDDGTIHAAANRDFVRDFMETVPPTEHGALQMPDGSLSQDGAKRVRNAIFAKAFGDSESGLAAIQRMAESTDNHVKNITNGLLAKAGSLAAFKAAAKAGTRHQEFDITPSLSKAMEKYAALKDSSTSIDDYIKQGNLFGAETTPFQTRVMQVFDHHKRSAKAIRGIIDNYLSAVEAIGDPKQQGLFGAGEKPSVESVFEGAVKAYEKHNNESDEPEQVGLFNAHQGRENESGSRSKSDADVGKTATTGEGAGVGENRLDAPYSKVSPPSTIEQRQMRVLERDLNRAILSDVTVQTLRDAQISPDGKLNEAATVLLTHAKMDVIANAPREAWFGVFLNPQTTQAVRNSLENLLGNASTLAARMFGRKLLKQFDAAVKKNGSVTFITSSRNVPNGLKAARQEEAAHEFDYFEGGKHDVSVEVISNDAVGKEAIRNLQKEGSGYEGARTSTLAKEVAAKIWVDGNNELGLTSEKIEYLQNLQKQAFVNTGITKEQFERAVGQIKNAGEIYEPARTSIERNQGNSIETEPDRQGEVFRGNQAGGRGTLPADRSATNYAKRPANGQTRQNQDLDSYQIPFGGENQSLAVRTRNEILYSRPSEAEINPEEIKADAEKATKSLVSYIYDGKRDVSPTEAAMNIMRTGYLAGLSVIKTNLLGNTSNLVVEQLAKPLMATADILNPKAKTRTTPGLSARDVIQGFFGTDGLFRSEVGFNKSDVGKAGILKSGVSLKNGFIKALVKGVDHQESSRVDMNVADKNTNFVRNTGVPLIDAVIEATKRIVTSVDRPFKAYARAAEKSGLARLAASKEKLTGLEWRRRMNELKQDPTALINDLAERYAEVVTFQNPNAVTQTYDKFRRFLIDDKAQARVIPTETQRKIAKYVGSAAYLATGQVAPFMSTPSNVGFRTLEYFFPTGIVAAAFKFHRIGQSFERRNFIEEQGLNRAKMVKRLAGVRGLQDRKFNSETDAKKERLNEQKKARNNAFKIEIEAVKNSKVLTDAAKSARIEQLKSSRDKWLAGWEKNLEEYLEGRKELSDKATAQRKVVDEITRKNWESEDAYADIKFSELENRAFAEAAGRAGFGATVGSLALLGVIYGLIKAVGTTDYDDEKDKSKEKRAAGIPDNSVSIFGYRFPYADNAFGNALKMGINLFEQYERPGSGYERAGAMAKRFGKDMTSLNPLTAQEFTKDDWASWAGSQANSMTPLLNLKILQEIGEVADDKPRKYWEEGFAAQYLIKIPGLRGNLPESKSFIGGEEERGDVWRRAIRAIDPLKTTKENSPQDELPDTPLSKSQTIDISTDKKLDDEVRKGKMSADEATRILTEDVNGGDISPSQYKQRIAALSQSKAVKAMADADASQEQDFADIEKILKNAAPEDKPVLEKVLIDKVKAKFNSKTNQGIADGQKLLEIHDKYF